MGQASKSVEAKSDLFVNSLLKGYSHGRKHSNTRWFRQHRSNPTLRRVIRADEEYGGNGLSGRRFHNWQNRLKIGGLTISVIRLTFGGPAD